MRRKNAKAKGSPKLKFLKKLQEFLESLNFLGVDKQERLRNEYSMLLGKDYNEKLEQEEDLPVQVQIPKKLIRDQYNQQLRKSK